jgi:DNA-binding NarL/FixJ family response regulator
MSTQNSPIRIVLADDHEIFRDGFRVMLKKQKDLELIAEAGNGKELIETVYIHKPDVVVTDIKMPVMDGIEAARSLKKLMPQVKVIALSMFEDENLVVDMMDAGAKGYLLKNANKEEVFDAIKTVYKNGTYYCNHTSLKLAKLIGNSNVGDISKTAGVSFSDREIAIIQLVCEQLSNKEIAEQLNLSPRTIESHRERIIEKMDVKNTVGLVIYAIRTKLYKLD